MIAYLALILANILEFVNTSTIRQETFFKFFFKFRALSANYRKKLRFSLNRPPDTTLNGHRVLIRRTDEIGYIFPKKKFFPGKCTCSSLIIG